MGALVSGPTGLEAFEAIVAEAPDWLDPGGTLVLELAPDQAEAVTKLARSPGRSGRSRCTGIWPAVIVCSSRDCAESTG